LNKNGFAYSGDWGLSLSKTALQKFEKMYLCTMIDVRIFSMPAKASSALLDDYYQN